MRRPSAILVLDRFAPLRARLLELLRGLTSEEWNRPTAAREWSVKDVAAHLLGGDIGVLSRVRDGYSPISKPPQNNSELVELVNRLNREWVVAARRMSSRLLCDLLAFAGAQVEAYFSLLDLNATGQPVSWAGPEPAPVWLDVARELTERWHHQQQIRDATGRPPLYDSFFVAPVLDTFMRALPYSFRGKPAPEKTILKIQISGESGSVWFLCRSQQKWELFLEAEGEAVAEVVLPQDAAWRMFTKGLDGLTARGLATIGGDAALVSPLFETIAVIG